MTIIKILREQNYAIIAISVFLLLFSLSYYIMTTLVGNAGNMCKIGAALTLKNIFFSFILSILASVMIAGLTKLINQKQIGLGSTSLLGFGTLTGIFTIFCTLCTLPIIMIGGFSVSLGFFTDYNNLFKLLSLLLMVIGLYLLNKQLNNQCLYECNIKK